MSNLAGVLNVSEMFMSIQGEGRWVGRPVVFVRLTGCTRTCSFCDTTYHTDGKDTTIEEILEYVEKSGLTSVVVTGGEPLLQLNSGLMDLLYLLQTRGFETMIETNGDLLKTVMDVTAILRYAYICVSPKDAETARRVHILRHEPLVAGGIDIKVVTDLEDLALDYLDYATMLMPLTTGGDLTDAEIKQRVWQYCTKHNVMYSPRLHVDVWGDKRGV